MEERRKESKMICLVWCLDVNTVLAKQRDLNRIGQSGCGSLRLNKPVRTPHYTTSRRGMVSPSHA